MKLPTSQIERPHLRSRATLAGMGDILESQDGTYTGMPATEDWSWIGQTARDIVIAWNQQKILEANLERAKRGLPPIDTSTLAPTYNVGLTPAARNLVIVGGIAGIIALFMLSGKRR